MECKPPSGFIEKTALSRKIKRETQSFLSGLCRVQLGELILPDALKLSFQCYPEGGADWSLRILISIVDETATLKIVLVKKKKKDWRAIAEEAVKTIKNGKTGETKITITLKKNGEARAEVVREVWVTVHPDNTYWVAKKLVFDLLKNNKK